MTTGTRLQETLVTPDLSELVDLDPAGVPCLGDATLPGLAAKAMLATVQCVDPPETRSALAWGIADGRTILFRVGDVAAREFQAAIDAGEQPTAIVEPEQLVAVDLNVDR